MEYQKITDQLEANRDVFNSLFSGISDEMIHWRNADEKWNFLEIACHLYDEEREDFGARLKLVLENPQDKYVKIDPVAWVKDRNYDSQDFQLTVKKFLDERTQTISWLRSLKNPPLENAFQHPTVGPISGHLFITNWLAHDYHHIRQINNLKYEFLKQHSTVPLDYAGKW